MQTGTAKAVARLMNFAQITCCHVPRKQTLLQPTCFSSTVDRNCASGFLLDI